nr:hypothetical protein [uncultured Capnocytophaga sp.]
MTKMFSYKKQDGTIVSIPQDILYDVSILDKPRIWVDFNTPFDDMYFLSRLDIIKDSEGNEIELKENMEVSVFDYDLDENDNPDHLLADGIAILNRTGIFTHVKWLIKVLPNKKYGRFYWVSDTKK